MFMYYCTLIFLIYMYTQSISFRPKMNQRSVWSLFNQEAEKPDDSKSGSASIPKEKEEKHYVTKQDLAQMIASEQDLSIAQSRRIVDSMFDSMVETLARNGIVKIGGFGSFESVDLKERKGIAPNGSNYVVGTRKKAKFRQYKALRDNLNNTT